ncbi:unnamed protein product [Schistosoma turkestanicum]|nr:unnamed protein product [Schistosoma turkestanicum]
MIVNHKWDSTNDETNKLNYLFENSSLLPSDLIDYPNQIGGHGLLFGNKCKRIRLFLGSNQPRASRLAKQFVRKLSELAHWFENQSTYHFYASSLLLAYDTVALNSSPPTPAYQHHQQQQQPLKHSHCINDCTQLDEPTEPFTTSSSSSVAVNAVVDSMATNNSNNNETTATVTSSLSSGDEEQDIQEEDHVLVYLIDFTRWELMSNSNKMKDENFLYGLNYLISLFKRASVESTTTTTTTITTID